MRFFPCLVGMLLVLVDMAIPAFASEPVTGIVIEVTDKTLEVKTLAGEVVGFLKPTSVSAPAVAVPPPPAIVLANIAKGMLVEVAYTVQKDKDSEQYRRVLNAPVKIVGRTLTGTVKEIAADKSWLVIRTRHPEKQDREMNVPVLTPARFQPLVDKMQPGDGVNATYTEEKTTFTRTVQGLEWQSEQVERFWRWASLLCAAALLLLLAFAVTRRPADLFLGEDNRYSTSKFQTVIWFWVVISAYMAIVFHRIFAAGWDYIGGVDIPENLLLLSGISVLTFATAKLITKGKVDQAALQGEIIKRLADSPPKIGDLIRSDNNRVDLGDYQMLTITVLAVVIYAISTVEFMAHIEFRREITMPDVDATLLAIFGLGQAAYLGKKAAGDMPPTNTQDGALKKNANEATTAKTEAGKAATAAQDARTKEADTRKAAEAVNEARNASHSSLEATSAAHSAEAIAASAKAEAATKP